MLIQQRQVKITAILLLILTIIWLIFTIISMSEVKSSWNDLDFIKWVSHPNFFFTGNYINATLLTIVAIFLFTFLFNFLKSKHDNIAIAGLIFVPTYGIINLLCYSIQISIVPSIANDTLNNQNTTIFVSQLIQANSKSLIGFMNGLAYTILGMYNALKNSDRK